MSQWDLIVPVERRSFGFMMVPWPKSKRGRRRSMQWIDQFQYRFRILPEERPARARPNARRRQARARRRWRARQ